MKGQRDYSRARLTRHALERYLERFCTGDPAGAETSLRSCLARTRRLGRNPDNAAVAILAAHGDRMLVAILQDEAITTVMTWPQFAPRLSEFGRAHLPRKPARMLRRLKQRSGIE